jgi:hypothetical protein
MTHTKRVTRCARGLVWRCRFAAPSPPIESCRRGLSCLACDFHLRRSRLSGRPAARTVDPRVGASTRTASDRLPGLLLLLGTVLLHHLLEKALGVLFQRKLERVEIAEHTTRHGAAGLLLGAALFSVGFHVSGTRRTTGCSPGWMSVLSELGVNWICETVPKSTDGSCTARNWPMRATLCRRARSSGRSRDSAPAGHASHNGARGAYDDGVLAPA